MYTPTDWVIIPHISPHWCLYHFNCQLNQDTANTAVSLDGNSSRESLLSTGTRCFSFHLIKLVFITTAFVQLNSLGPHQNSWYFIILNGIAGNVYTTNPLIYRRRWRRTWYDDSNRGKDHNRNHHQHHFSNYPSSLITLPFNSQVSTPVWSPTIAKTAIFVIMVILMAINTLTVIIVQNSLYHKYI